MPWMQAFCFVSSPGTSYQSEKAESVHRNLFSILCVAILGGTGKNPKDDSASSSVHCEDIVNNPVAVRFILLLLFVLASQPLLAQFRLSALPDSILNKQSVDDPFGPEHSPDHTGQGSGGVLTPSPYENTIHTYFTSINADFYGIQMMLDSPLQIAVGTSWSAYQAHNYGFQAKVRTTGFREREIDILRRQDVPYYLLSAEGSFDYPYRDHGFRAWKVRVHWKTTMEGLSMAGIGFLVSRGNLLVGSDRPMGRRFDGELTWLQVAGGYVMPLSPQQGGVNLAVCFGVDLLGLKYQTYYSGLGEYYGAKIGSVGWVADFGWNVGRLVNLSTYVGGEWGFSTGGLQTSTGKLVFADVARTSIFLGIQATGRWFNLTGGVAKEWEYIEFQSTEDADRGLHYHLGASIYFRR
jgi:hypothetical protein